ncbi:polyprenyl synthetase family protein [Phycicoccus sp. CSK15P-2]|uniref:polyprenyl synthetase family protein n=1 Tax=Phycicoccus sp. CSK15P-2 TaxID=2807627 RepID=UPI00194F32BC|nr:polyprenyl synthetase family protein [Phycicoccus sp. CSK15P-2]MBM6405308.1 polyprenyl synthetase family protein [Phycicoccus sp. CSK15P-2]
MALDTAAPTPVEQTLADVDHLLTETLDDVRAELARAVTGTGPDARVDAGALRVGLVDELGTRLMHHGKRIRPRLTHWGWVLAGAPASARDDLVRVAAAMELLHLFGLLQDDVMDRSDTRRGRTTLHVEATGRHRRADGLGDATLFGDSVAVLVGDLALAEAAMLVSPTSPEVRRVWRLMTVELVEGQLLDVTHAADRRRDVTTSRRIARLKSGRYTITRPLQLGALVAGADPAHVERLLTWGDLVGDAFALRDDVLGVWGDPAVTGKPSGDDLASGKPTVLLTWADEMLPDHARPLLAACDAGTLEPDGVTALQQAMDAAGVRERAEQDIAGLAETAGERLPLVGADPAADAALRELVSSIAWRTS